MEKTGSFILPNLTGVALMVIGWYISILNVGLTRFEPNVLFTKWTLMGLGLIIIGAYFPRVWARFRGN
ncbi:MAG TPA: hypothetical protein VLM75_14430 [Spirochaetota bacterium]|nr:hypothetical protein [Spirochaetota bacterium]